VQAEEGERAEQQAGHGQENNVEQRIMFRVQRIGVRLVFGETDGGARMTLLAGGEDVGFGQVRRRIGRRQHVVMTVAVVAGGHGRGEFGLPSAMALPW
jgi:hypothetical protein